MTEKIIDSEWSSLAKDDGSLVLEQFEYDVVIGGENAQEITTTPTRINYSPSVNKAKDITLEVPPDANLEDLTYLGEPLKMYVDRELAFIGEIKEIETRQKNGEDYTVYGRPFGKKLKGSIVERTANNEIVSDVISKLVDRYNTIDGEHENYAGTNSESLSDVLQVGGNVRKASSSTATATYSFVGDNLSDVTSIYVKAYVPSDETMEITPITSSTSESETISNLDRNQYGEWRRLSNFADVSESYDLEFALDLNCLLMDWLVVVDESVKRDTTTPNVETVGTQQSLYSWSNSKLETETQSSGDGIVFDGSGRPQNRQITTWAQSPFPEYTGDDEFNGGVAGRLAYGDSTSEWTLDEPVDSLSNWDLYARVKPFEMFVNRNSTHTGGNTIYDDDWSGSATSSTAQVAVDDSSVEITGEASKSFQWNYVRDQQFVDLVFQGQAYLPSSSVNISWILNAGPFTSSDTDDGYGLSINSNGLVIERFDAGSGTYLNTDSNFIPQTDEWFDWEIIVSDTDITVSISDSTGTYSISASDSTHNTLGEFTVDTINNHYLDDMFAEPDASTLNTNLTTSINGNSFNYSLGFDHPYREITWERIASYDFTSSYPDAITSSTDVNITAEASSEIAFMISPMVAVHEGSNWSSSDFDVNLHQASGYLDSPSLFAQGDKFGNEIKFNEQISDDNIYEGIIQSTITNTTDPVNEWGVSQVIDISATDFPVPSNSQDETREFSYPGVQHITQATLTASGSRDTSSPRFGFNSQRMDSLDVSVSTNNLGVIFDQDLNGNRLSEMNTLANESTVFFRWEGDLARIFHSGQETTNVNLNSENIYSSVSIEDVYRYCEVIGIHNIRSGELESVDAPSYVDDKMVIRDEAIETVSDARSRARQFLEEHGTLKFKGTIQTMPTFAPLGAKVDGSMFNHGQDMIINGVSYGKTSTRITLGHDKNIATEIISLHSSTGSTKGRVTGKGMKVPVGEEQI